MSPVAAIAARLERQAALLRLLAGVTPEEARGALLGAAALLVEPPAPSPRAGLVNFGRLAASQDNFGPFEPVDPPDAPEEKRAPLPLSSPPLTPSLGRIPPVTRLLRGPEKQALAREMLDRIRDAKPPGLTTSEVLRTEGSPFATVYRERKSILMSLARNDLVQKAAATRRWTLTPSSSERSSSPANPSGLSPESGLPRERGSSGRSATPPSSERPGSLTASGAT